MIEQFTFKTIFYYWIEFEEVLLNFLVLLTRPFGEIFEEWAENIFGMSIDIPSFVILDMSFFDMILIYLPIILIFAFIAFLYNAIIDFIPFS